MKNRITFGLVVAMIMGISMLITGCAGQPQQGVWFDTFRDIPGVTQEHIEAIEHLREQHDYFVYAMLPNDEAFLATNGEVLGFAAHMSNWLTEIFDIPFIPTIVEWTELIEGLENGDIHFTGQLTRTDERELIYAMTDPIVQRSLTIVRAVDAEPLWDIVATRPPRFIFYAGTVTAGILESANAFDYFEAIHVYYPDEVARLLLNGEADGFIGDGAQTLSIAFPDFVVQPLYPFVFGSASFSAQNEDLFLLVEIVQKAMENGGLSILAGLYSQGIEDFMRHRLDLLLTDEEREFIANNPVIQVAPQFYTYPISFFNRFEQSYQGMAFDILHQVEVLTGLQFEAQYRHGARMHGVIDLLEAGEVSVAIGSFRPEIAAEMPEGILFSNPFFADHYAMLSRSTLPNIGVNEVMYTRVGVVTNTIYETRFNTLFPDHINLLLYPDLDTMFDALYNGEIDLAFTSHSRLLRLTNFHEWVGFKANIIFDEPYDVIFCLAEDEHLLLSIINKSLMVIDTESIVNEWMGRTFDYTTMLAQAQRPWFIGIIVLLVSVLALSAVLVNIQRNKGRELRKLVSERTSELEASMAELKEIEELNSLILTSSPFIVNIWDDTPSLVSTSQQAVEMFGLDNQEQYIQRFPELSPEHQPCGTPSGEKAINFVKQAFDEGRSQFEWIHQNLNGEPIPTEVTLVRFTRKGKYFVAAYTVDLRPIKAALESEREAHELTQTIINSAPFVINLWDDNRNLISTSQQALELYNVSSEEEYIRYFHKLSPKHQPCGGLSEELVSVRLNEAYEKGYSRFEWLHLTSEGKPVPTEITLVRFERRGKPMIVAFTTDLSMAKEAMQREREMELKLQEQEVNDRIQLMFDDAPMAVNIVDENGKLVDCNVNGAKMFGFSDKEEFIVRFREDAMSPEYQPCGLLSREKFFLMLNETAENGYVRFEWMCIDADGEELPTEVTTVRIAYEDTYQVVAYIRDLREIKASLEKEQEAIGLQKQIYESNPIPSSLWSMELEPMDCNDALVKLLGLSSREGFFANFLEFNPPTQLGGLPTLDAIKEAGTKTLENGSHRFPWTFLGADGEEIPGEATAVFIDSEDKKYLSVHFIDMRPIYAAMEREREVNEMVSTLLETAPLFIEIWDEQLNLVDCNNKFLEIFGLSSKDELFEKYDDLSPEYQPCGMTSEDKLNELLNQALQGHHATSEWMSLDANGEELPLETTFVYFTRQGRRSIVGYSHDLRQIKKAMSEMQRIEVAEESNRAKSRFLARMSHEIRTPITAVMGISEIQLRNTDLPPVVEESFAKIHNSSGMLLGIINDILDLSKIEAGKMTLLCEKYAVSHMINDVAHLHFTFAGSKNIEFRINVDEDLPTHLIGDALRIGQIMNNIISNAFKYTESGAVELSLSCQLDGLLENHATLVVSVKDTGMGMTSQQLDELYSDYTRFHEKYNRNIGGTGLGMSIAYSLLQMMDARIEITSEVGKGTNVVMYIPQEVAGSEVLGKEKAQKLQRFDVGERNSSKRFDFTPEPMPYGSVLVVDDIEANLYVAQGLLSFYDLNIETCESGYEAIEKVKGGKVYDIIFMDQMMPGMDGTQTMLELRGMGYTHPIVTLTANALIGQAEVFMKEGFDGFISKPIQTRHLNTILVKHIRDKQPKEVIEAAKASRGDLRHLGQVDINGFQNDAGLIEKLRGDFARGQKNTLRDLTGALDAGDIKTAHLLAHSLKGLAGLIGENSLVQISAEVERLLASGETPSVEQLNALGVELTRVLNGIGKPMIDAPTNDEEFDKDATMVILEKLEPLLRSRSTNSVDLVEELRHIPEAAVLNRQIQSFDFGAALKTLNVLKAILEER